MWDEAWPSLPIQNLEKSLDSLVLLVRDHDPSDDEIMAQLARFLVVRISGYLEQVIEECCKAYLKSKSSPEAASFGESWLGRGRNPRPGALREFVKKFDNQNWIDDLEALLNENDEDIHRQLAFLVASRNKIAHGESESVTVRKALDLVDPAKRTAEWFISTLDPR